MKALHDDELREQRRHRRGHESDSGQPRRGMRIEFEDVLDVEAGGLDRNRRHQAERQAEGDEGKHARFVPVQPALPRAMGFPR
jgi:hypothetical protein